MKALTKKCLAIALAAALFLSIIDGPAMLAQWWNNRLASWDLNGLHFTVKDSGAGETTHLRFSVGANAGMGHDVGSSFILNDAGDEPIIPILKSIYVDPYREEVYDESGQKAYRTNVVQLTSDGCTTRDVSIHWELNNGWNGLSSIISSYVFVKYYDKEFSIVDEREYWAYFNGDRSYDVWIGDIDESTIVSVRSCYWGSFAMLQDINPSEADLATPFGVTAVVSAEPASDGPMGSVPVDAGTPTVTPPPSIGDGLKKVLERPPENVEDIDTGSEDLGAETIPTPPETVSGG